MSKVERDSPKLPVTGEVGSEGGSYADAANQVQTFSGPADPNVSPADAIAGRMSIANEAAARGPLAGTSVGTSDGDTASGIIRYPTEPPFPANASESRKMSGRPLRNGLIGAAAGAAVVFALSRLRRRPCC
jgi:hypothetical protein